MKILVTGTTGQLVRSLLERGKLHPELEVVALGRPYLDLAHTGSIAAMVEALEPDLIVSAAAFTAVDLAESQPALAQSINVEGPAALARAANSFGTPIIHLSTDYVFAGDKPTAYEETDTPAPLNVYGRTKLEGELAVRAATPRHMILRTSWVYSPFGRNFIRTILSRAAEGRETFSVVADQWGNPTSALNLADAILHLAPQLDRKTYGLYHLAGTGATNWAGLARHILAASRDAGGAFAEVIDITADSYPAACVRPANSRLSSHLFETTFGWRMPTWQQSAGEVAQRIVAEINESARNSGEPPAGPQS